MTMERWQPEKGLSVGQPSKEMEDISGWPFLPGVWRVYPSEEMAWEPAIDIVEEEDKFTVKAELPGVKEEDVNVSVASGALTIEGEKKAESEVKRKGYYYSETSYGSFSRSLTIPSSVEVSKIEAIYNQGVLEIILPKAPDVKPRKIAVAARKKEEATSKNKESATGN